MVFLTASCPPPQAPAAHGDMGTWGQGHPCSHHRCWGLPRSPGRVPKPRWESAAITGLLRVLPLGFVTHGVSHLGYDCLEGVAMLFPCQAVAFLALAMSGFTAIVVILGSGRGFFVVVVCLFFMLQELILGKVPFFSLFPQRPGKRQPAGMLPRATRG